MQKKVKKKDYKWKLRNEDYYNTANGGIQPWQDNTSANGSVDSLRNAADQIIYDDEASDSVHESLVPM